jgi:hypothetical protein
VRVPSGYTEVVHVRETIFADDASPYAASVGGMQKMADACRYVALWVYWNARI